MLSQIEVLDRIPEEEISIMDKYIKKYDAEPEQMVVEDLSALDKLSEERISDVLKQRLEKGESYTFAGDVLISLNSNELPKEFSRAVSVCVCVFIFFLFNEFAFYSNVSQYEGVVFFL